MASDPISNPPPGFDELSRDEQLEYIQKLWDHIAADSKTVPVPDWHLEIVCERNKSHDPEKVKDWGDIKARLAGKYSE